MTKDGLDCILAMVKDSHVTLDLSHPDHNPYASIDPQATEDARIKRFNTRNGTTVVSRNASDIKYRHDRLTLKSPNCVRTITKSYKKIILLSSGEYTDNPQIETWEKIPDDKKALFALGVCLLSIRFVWKSCMDNDIYSWAEIQGWTRFLHDDDFSYMYDTFERDRDSVQTLVDIFGYETIENVMIDLSGNTL